MCGKLSFDTNLALKHQQLSEQKLSTKKLVKFDFTTHVTFSWKRSPFSVQVSTVSKTTLRRMEEREVYLCGVKTQTSTDVDDLLAFDCFVCYHNSLSLDVTSHKSNYKWRQRRTLFLTILSDQIKIFSCAEANECGKFSLSFCCWQIPQL